MRSITIIINSSVIVKSKHCVAEFRLEALPDAIDDIIVLVECKLTSTKRTQRRNRNKSRTSNLHLIFSKLTKFVVQVYLLCIKNVGKFVRILNGIQ